MPRYRNIGSLPLNYGDGCPRVEPFEQFQTDDYPRMPLDQVATHVRMGFLEELAPPATAAAEPASPPEE